MSSSYPVVAHRNGPNDTRRIYGGPYKNEMVDNRHIDDFGTGTHIHHNVEGGSKETRPKNVAVNCFVKVKSSIKKSESP